MKDTGAFESELGAFVATIPWNFYALLCLILVVFICLTSYDFGPMRRAEINAQRDQELSEEGVQEVDREVKSNPHGTVWDMLIPLVALIVFSVLSLMYSGGYWGEDAKYHTFMAAIGNSSASMSLVWASFGAMVVALLLFVPRRLLSFADFFNGSVEGMKIMLPANIILILAWTLSGVCRELLSTPAVHAVHRHKFRHERDVPAGDCLCDCGVSFLLNGHGLGYLRYPHPHRSADCAGS